MVHPTEYTKLVMYGYAKLHAIQAATRKGKNMSEYFVVWAGDDGVITQSKVETICDPLMMTPHDWVMLAAESEDTVIEEWESYDLFCVIDHPSTFYQ
jgi:hypothetical protein